MKTKAKGAKKNRVFIIRLDAEHEQKLEFLTEKEGSNKSEVVRELIGEKFEQLRKTESRLGKKPIIPSFSLPTKIPRETTFTKEQIYGDFFDSSTF